MKRQITEYFENIYWREWDGETFLKFKDYMNNLEIPDEATIEHDWDSTGITIELKREETDEEYEKRLAEIAKKQVIYLESAAKREKEEYLRLKAKFENL